MSEHLRCRECGGSVVYDVAVTGAACLFCGAVALSAVPAGEPVPVPHAALPLAVAVDAANQQYRQWAQASWFYPRALRDLRVELTPMYLPAWRFSSKVETHWAGLRRAATRSGKEPVGGEERVDLYHMVPASAGLTQNELSRLLPFDESKEMAWNPAAQNLPWEPPALSEQGARIPAHQAMADHHGQAIARRRSLTVCKVSPVVRDRDVKLFMLPIYIGAFRFRDRPWRFVVNAQSGEVVGKAPIDRIKVALLILGGLAVIAAIVLAVKLWS